MNVLIITDKEGSAIWRLSQGVKKNNSHLNIEVIDVHPKRPSLEQLNKFEILAEQADVLDFQYWKTAMMLIDEYPNLCNKPKILQHHNPYNLFESDWKVFDKVVVNNETMQERLKGSELIGNTIDFDLFRFKRDYTESKNIIMVAARIEGKKGILPVANVCKKLSYKLILIGSISDREYFEKVMATGVVDFREKITDKELVESYYESAIHVCNSVDDFESGPLPVIEAMICGVPVLTRNVGHIPDINNDKNMIVRQGQPEDEADLEYCLKELMDDRKKREEMREIAWNSAKTRDDRRRALQYEKLYWDVFTHGQELVSVIIPTFNRKVLLLEVIEGVINQDYPAKEVIVCDDGSMPDTKEMIDKIKQESPVLIKYVNSGTPKEYNLAYVKNLGVIEASGEILMFIDDRYKMKGTQFINDMVKDLKHKYWLFGNKNGKQTFVENVSCIYKDDFVNAGMFNTTVKTYGFQTQEIRNRFKNQGFKFEYIPNAEVDILINTKNRYTKKDEIIYSKNALDRLGLG